MRNWILILIGIFCSLQAFAQFPPRVDDHFWRRKVMYRLDYQEKINKPMTEKEHWTYEKVEGRYGHKKGMIDALIAGFSEKKYTGYYPDRLDTTMAYEEFKHRLEGGDASQIKKKEERSEDEGEEEEPADDEEATDDLKEGPSKGAELSKSNLLALETIVDIIEDRIFDKNKSDMYYDIQWIILTFVDPRGETIDRPVVAFRYRDVMDQLNGTQWKNRFNDAEYRSVQEILELRLFTSLNIIVSGEDVNPEQFEKRRQQMLEFEHHLWNY